MHIIFKKFESVKLITNKMVIQTIFLKEAI